MFEEKQEARKVLDIAAFFKELAPDPIDFSRAQFASRDDKLCGFARACAGAHSLDGNFWAETLAGSHGFLETGGAAKKPPTGMWTDQFKARVGAALENEYGFKEFEVIGGGNCAIVFRVVGEGIVLRLSRADEMCEARPLLGEILQAIDSFHFIDFSNYWNPLYPVKGQLFLEGTLDATKKEVEMLRTSLSFKGYCWPDANTGNAVRLSDGKVYVADAGEVFPHNRYGFPAPVPSYERTEQLRDSFRAGEYSFVGVKSPFWTKVMRSYGEVRFFLAQALAANHEKCRWELADQMKLLPEKYKPRSQFLGNATLKRTDRYRESKKELEEYIKQKEIDIDALDRCIGLASKLFPELNSFRLSLLVEQSAKDASVAIGIPSWTQLSAQRRSELTLMQMRK